MNIIEKARRLEGWIEEDELTDGQLADLIHERDRYKRASDLMNQLVELAGSSTRGDEIIAGLIQGLVQSHRHKQMKAIMALLHTLGEYGKLPRGQYVDGRNEIVHGHCRKLRENLKTEIFWRD